MGSRIVVGLGAGGHAKGLIELVGRTPGLELGGLIVAERGSAPAAVLGVPVLGDESLLPTLRSRGITHFFIAIGGVGDNRARCDAFSRAQAAGLEPLALVHPAAVVSASARLAAGCSVLAGAVIGAEATLGPNALVNSMALVEHDAVVGAHAHVSIGARLSGGVTVGEGAHVGAGAVVLEGRSLGDGALVAAGAVVTSDVGEAERVGGVPAAPLRSGRSEPVVATSQPAEPRA
jgi:UDP-perosamine 4-acetyltransferase